jgi:transposase InsO family protein
MPWKESDAMTERARFVLEWHRRWKQQQGRVNVAELCRIFGVTRPCGYRWIARFRDGGFKVAALAERSRRPRHSPTAISEHMQDALVGARKRHPTWGPRKLRAWLVDRYPQTQFPAASTIGDILTRRGLVAPRKRRKRHRPPLTNPFADAIAPNSVWCIDFKGQFRTGDGEVCYPFTVSDAFSRFVIRCEVVDDPDGPTVEAILDSAFREFGLPAAIRSDNGPPFASNAAGGLTALAVWLLRLGIRLERIDPGKPQQNGRHERMHLTLKLDTASPPAGTRRAQQRRLDRWRHEFNQERPHEALGNKPPSSVFTLSAYRYPRPLIRFEIGFASRELRVERDGTIRIDRERVFISTALYGEFVELAPDSGTRWRVLFGPVLLGTLDADDLRRGLSLAPRRRCLGGPTP